NRDPDDPLGGDHALLAAGGAWDKTHVTGATAGRAGMEGGHASRAPPAPLGVTIPSTVSPSGRSAFGIPALVKFRKRRSASASKDGRTARGSPRRDNASPRRAAR